MTKWKCWTQPKISLKIKKIYMYNYIAAFRFPENSEYILRYNYLYSVCRELTVRKYSENPVCVVLDLSPFPYRIHHLPPKMWKPNISKLAFLFY